VTAFRLRPLRHAAALALLVAIGAAALPLRAEDVPPGERIDPATVDDSWRALFDALAAQGAVFSTFTERRWFSVRPQAVELQGELRHSLEHGLSLHYTQPETQTMIVDAQGILLRNAAGRERALKTDPRAPQIDTMLLHILRFDLAALHRLFEIRGRREAAGWRLEFTARSPELDRAVGRVTVDGVDAGVRRLEFSRGPKQRVEVEIRETRTGVTFTADELTKYFRRAR